MHLFHEEDGLHLLLVRHGESFVNLEDWTEGFIDAGLTPLGKLQAEHVGRWMAENLRIDALYTSTMARTLETAVCLAKATGLVARPDHRLREFGNCYASGAPVPAEAMPIPYPSWWGTERPHIPIFEGGESWMLFRVRVGAFLAEILAEHGSAEPETAVVAVCHGGVIDATFDYIFNVGPQRPVEVWTHNTGIVHWEYTPSSVRERWRLHSHGLVHHLTDGMGEWLGSSPMLRGATRKPVPLEDEVEQDAR
jgi:probable phosphoglycerate mutase